MPTSPWAWPITPNKSAGSVTCSVIGSHWNFPRLRSLSYLLSMFVSSHSWCFLNLCIPLYLCRSTRHQPDTAQRIQKVSGLVGCWTDKLTSFKINYYFDLVTFKGRLSKFRDSKKTFPEMFRIKHIAMIKGGGRGIFFNFCGLLTIYEL